ncbi:MAG: cytochrome c biogenesis protein CcsA [Gemmataceae bacterium]
MTLFLASLAANLLAATVAIGLIYGLWYLARKEAILEWPVRILSGLVLLGAVGYAIHLLLERMQRTSTTGSPGLPLSAYSLQQFGFTDESRKVVTWMIYGTICFAMLFSFVGTVLGGIWADQSWGRFWGWDPKENGALLIVIMNALILHARWGGMIKDRGMATLAIVGNMITMWSWFGTNQLGIGLHAYGFNNALVALCRWFWISQLVLIGVALLPLQNWQSYSPVVLESARSEPSRPPRQKGKRGLTGIQPT